MPALGRLQPAFDKLHLTLGLVLLVLLGNCEDMAIPLSALGHEKLIATSRHLMGIPELPEFGVGTLEKDTRKSGQEVSHSTAMWKHEELKSTRPDNKTHL